MRVAHVLRKYDATEWGGTETALLRLTEGLRGHGVHSVIYGPRTDQVAAVDPLAACGAEVRRFRACVPILGLAPAQRCRMTAVGGNLWSFDLLPALLREPELDVVHTHALGRLGGIAMTAARIRHVPCVVSIHGGALDLPAVPSSGRLQSPARNLEWGRVFGALVGARRLFDHADAILACNETEARLLREKHPGRRIQVQPHGIPVAIFQKDRRSDAISAFPETRARPVLLSPGRIDPVKNQDWLLQQLPALINRCPKILLVLAGACTDSTYRCALERRLDQLNLRHNVLITGGLPSGDPRLVGLFQTARAVLLPSVSETFGVVILEAWAAGTPVIASRTTGASSLIRDGVNGWLFDLSRPDGFHRAVHCTLEDADCAAQLAATAARQVADNYDQEALSAGLYELYQELVLQKRATRFLSRAFLRTRSHH